MVGLEVQKKKSFNFTVYDSMDELLDAKQTRKDIEKQIEELQKKLDSM